MRHDKEKAFTLRREGKTYREIEKLLGMTRSTLCEWFRNEEWSHHIKNNNNAKNIKIHTEHLRKMNEARADMLLKKYEAVEENAEKEFEFYKDDPLFMAGLMLYAGEGDKATRGVIRFANTDFYLHKVFLRFVEKFLSLAVSRLKVSILLYPDLDIEECKSKWSEELNIPLINFHKPQVVQGKSSIRRLQFGVGSTIISDSFLKKKLLRWIEMAQITLST